MSHSLNQVWIHAVWSTKYRNAFIVPEVEARVYELIKDQFAQTGCKLIAVNGMDDHIHCLFLLDLKKSLAEIMNQVKGRTAYEINQKRMLDQKFQWQTGYGVFSVKTKEVKRVETYIKNQKHHHSLPAKA